MRKWLVVQRIPKCDAVSELGRSDLIDKELYFVANKEEIDEFRSGCLVELETAKNLDLIKVDGTVCRPSLDKKGSIDRQAFRSPFKLPVKSAETLRSILLKSADPLSSRATREEDSIELQPSVDQSEEGKPLGRDEDHMAAAEKPKAEVSDAEPETDLDEIAKKIDEECANLEGQDVDAVVKRRLGQGGFRNLLLDRFDGACCMTGLTNPRLLIASHIVPWSESTGTQKLDPENGLLLSVPMDALFDKGLISFSSNGRILVGNDLDSQTIEILGLERDFALPEKLLTKARKENLAKHRERHGFELSL